VEHKQDNREKIMPELHRRQFIGAATTVALAATLSQSQALGADVAAPSAGAAITYDVKPLPFDPKTIPGFSEKILVSHHDNNYSGAVKRLNAINGQLATLDWANAPTFQINGLKREQLIAMNSMILHEHYFASFAGKESAPKGKLANAIARDFGSLDRWRSEFVAMGKALGGGSGWIVLAYSPHDKRLINAWASDHTTSLAGGQPVLVFDMFEHAYQMDFGAKAAAYVDAYLAAMKWDDAEKRFAGYA
jgi:Fe-Mn family superoxide dismutase